MGGDQAAALREATEQLKAAQEALKQQQAASTAAPTTAATPATSTTDIAGLRKQLGIDDLMSSISSLQATQKDTSQFEMPQFEMPQFEMPQFEMPDFGSMLEQYLPKQGATEQGTQQAATTAATPAKTGKQKTPGTKITVGGKQYDLSKTGGAGLGLKDIKNLQKLGIGSKGIRKAADLTTAAGKSVSKQAQSFLNQLGGSKAKPSATAQTKARAITTSARKTVAAAAKPAARPAAKPAARPAARPAAKPAARPAARPASRGKK